MLISIITITRKHLSGLKATAASLAQENSHLFEWIVIDGASTDGTVEYLHNTHPLTPPLSPPGRGRSPSGAEGEGAKCWLSEPDNGIYDAMNKGIERARGEYVLFLNAGDTLALPRTLDTLAEILKARPTQPDLIYGDAFEDTPEGRITKTARPHGQLRQGLFTHHQAIFYARAVMNDLRYDQTYDIAADYKFTAEFLRRADDVFYWPRPVCSFEAGGVSQRQAFKGRMQQSLIRRELQMTLPIEEVLIVLKQTAAYTLRRVAPKLYWRLRATSV